MTTQRSLLSLFLSTRALVATSYIPSLQRMYHKSFALESVANDKAANQPSPPFTLSSFYGGDYAGLSATFSAATGDLIPVPEYLVPDALLEWGQGPSCLEVIVSEDFENDKLTRQTVTVVPDVGCGIDNLDTMKDEQVIDTLKECLNIFENDSVVALDCTLPNKATRSETTFSLQNGQRMRVMVDMQDKQVKSPITLVLEQQTSTTSSGGTIADGGGLDGRTVSRLLGDLAKGKPFAEMEPAQWDDADKQSTRTLLHLPGNVTVAYDEDLTVLKVGHVKDDSIRRVVRRSFRADGSLESIEYT